MSIEIKGLDELKEHLDQMQQNAKELEQTKSVSFSDLFTSSFMQKHTEFSSIDKLFKAGNFIVESQEDFEAISESELDAHVNKTTNFSSWQDMLDEAVKEFTAKKLGL